MGKKHFIHEIVPSDCRDEVEQKINRIYDTFGNRVVSLTVTPINKTGSVLSSAYDICLIYESYLKESEYIDLGLPSGTLWATENEDDEYTFDDAVEKFGDSLPKLWQLCELWENCTVRDNMLIGPNGNSLKIPSGYYWSSTAGYSDYAYYLFFYGSGVYVYYDRRSDAYSVRLCKSKK